MEEWRGGRAGEGGEGREGVIGGGGSGDGVKKREIESVPRPVASWAINSLASRGWRWSLYIWWWQECVAQRGHNKNVMHSR